MRLIYAKNRGGFIMKQSDASSNLKKIKDELGRRLIALRYSKVSIDSQMRIFGWVEDYLNGYSEMNYSKELGQQFLIEYQLQSNHSPSQFKNARTLIRRMDEIMENKHFTPCFRNENIEYPSRFTNIRDKYLESLRKQSYKESTIKSKRMHAGQLFSRLPQTVLSLEKLSATDIYDVLKNHEWPLASLGTARSILSFLFKIGITKINLSVCVPKRKRPKSLPSVYSGDEVRKLLSSVDRTTSFGIRNYAILILAAYLGLRNSDIVNLSFKDIDYTTKSINIIQVKTEKQSKLVMNSEVEEAIKDYLQNGRPQSSIENIFLSSQAPFTPLTAGCVYQIVKRQFMLAGIAAQGRKVGAHALRASYATALVGKGVPYAVVKEALGHRYQSSLKNYVRVDVRRLRICAIDVPQPQGTFAVMLESQVRSELKGVIK
jgi:site-specific recombinase XerD